MTEEFDFEKFRRGMKPAPKTPSFSIHKSGDFGLNRTAYEMLGSPSHVELLFDGDRQVIGIRAADPEDRDAYQIRKQSRSESYVASGRAFCSRYGIPFGQGSRQYRPELHRDVLVIDLHAADNDPAE